MLSTKPVECRGARGCDRIVFATFADSDTVQDAQNNWALGRSEGRMRLEWRDHCASCGA
jgi:hypothetical protein